VKGIFASKTNQSALIVCDRFAVYIPTGGTPNNVAAILSAVAKPADWHANGGVLAARLIGAIHPAKKPVIYSTVRGNVLPETSFKYVLSPAAGGAPDVAMYWNGSLSVSGSLREFVASSKTFTGLEGVKHKIIEFKYNGGSRPGRIRKVRAEDVRIESNDVVIDGYDLEFSGELKRGFRRYLGSKIEGDIRVL
jgi:hypothetical protein